MRRESTKVSDIYLERFRFSVIICYRCIPETGNQILRADSTWDLLFLTKAII